jgi:hypothetical protein
VFLFHSPTLALWLALVDTCFVTTDSITQKGVTFLMMLIQKAVNRCPNGYASPVLWVVL